MKEFLRIIALGLLWPALYSRCEEAFTTERFYFVSDGNRLSGLLDTPIDAEPTATIVLVHGYGSTNVVAQNWYYDMRARFASHGLAFLIWDKPGCGESEGVFDINQSVQSSAVEVADAIRELRLRDVPSSDRIGLWGISRAGWIAPLAIEADPSISFWISVSGTEDKENFKYLLETNFRIEGRSAEETERLVSAWQSSFDTLRKGGTYDDYLDADRNLRKDPFYQYLTNGGNPWDRNGFLKEQKRYLSGEIEVDEETGLMIYVPQFRETLNAINMPVLAMFGEKDSNVDWRKTVALYKETIGKNPDASLTIKTFPDGNHVIQKCETGGVREMNESGGRASYSDGYYETMINWMQEHGFAR